MVQDDQGFLDQLDSHLSSLNQAWLLGAGTCKEAGIPLMGPLTERVLAMVDTEHKAVLDAIINELPENNFNIEDLLSHLGDCITFANRSRNNSISLDESHFDAEVLNAAHREVLERIAQTVRWGFVPCDSGNDSVGTADTPIIKVIEHCDFVKALFEVRRAGLEQRGFPVRLFTTNYDTLLEDALALNSVHCWDGFSGGAVAYRDYRFGDEPPTNYRAHVVKLHGSIDWTLVDGRVWRVRNQDAYPERAEPVLIHPQATKYVATQRDPFAAQFDLFRRALSRGDGNVLAICGYSFGDEHINQEIELAMERAGNQMTMLAFCNEGDSMPECLANWRSSPWGNRMYLATEKGLYVGNKGPFNAPDTGQTKDWWTFAGVTNLLKNGARQSS